MNNHFVDLCYNSLMLLRGGENDKTYVNQSGLTVRRTGMLRIRAMEQLRVLIHLLSKQNQHTIKQQLGETLRKKIIETMLYMMRTYHQCSISHQQGLLVLNTIRATYDEDDLETMKAFVKTELENDMNFYYPSGRTTSRMNLGQIIKIAIELRTITQKAVDEMDSGEDTDDVDNPDADADSIQKRSKLQTWFKFCEEKVGSIEKIWNRKLENPNANEPVQDSEDDQFNDLTEQTIDQMFKNFQQNRLIKAKSQEGSLGSNSDMEKDAKAALEENKAKDDVFGNKTTGEFGNNQFWSAPEMYDIDDLMAELGE